MKKLIVIGLLALSLGGCAQLQAVGTGVSLATKSVANPVTKQELYEIEASIQIAVVALRTYRKACEQNAVDSACRANIRAIQPYTRGLVPLLTQLRSFVKQNDQVNAWVAYNQLVTLYTNLKSTATNLGMKVS